LLSPIAVLPYEDRQPIGSAERIQAGLPEGHGADEPGLLKPVPVGPDDANDDERDESGEADPGPSEEDRRWWAEQTDQAKGGDQ
jgi:hypothetical protein